MAKGNLYKKRITILKQYRQKNSVLIRVSVAQENFYKKRITFLKQHRQKKFCVNPGFCGKRKSAFLRQTKHGSKEKPVEHST